MAALVTRQVSGGIALALAPASTGPENGQPLEAAVAELPVLDASGKWVPFGALFRERRAVVVFVRVSAGCGQWSEPSRLLGGRYLDGVGWAQLFPLGFRAFRTPGSCRSL
jgi:hypothetical protein